MRGDPPATDTLARKLAAELDNQLLEDFLDWLYFTGDVSTLRNYLRQELDEREKVSYWAIKRR